MNFNKLKLIGAVATLVIGTVFVNSPVQAYSVIDENVIRLDSEHILFSITYRFGFLNRELSIPMTAIRGSSTNPYHVGYELTDITHAPTHVGSATAVVLSTAEIRGSEYYIPAGRNADFTLISLVRLPIQTEPLALSITYLPFSLVNEGRSERVRLEADTLKTYRTSLLQ